MKNHVFCSNFSCLNVCERKICHLLYNLITLHKKLSFPLKVTSAKKRYLFQMCHWRHRLRIFLFRRKIMLRSQDIQVFVFLTIPWFTKCMGSRWVLVHETRCIFKSFLPFLAFLIFWTTTLEVTELSQLIDISKSNTFQ